MRRLGRPDADDGTWSLMFDEQGRCAFAAAHRAPDCAAAMRAARERITDPTRYRDRIDLASLTVRAAGPLAEVDACRVRWRENALGELLTGTTAAVLRIVRTKRSAIAFARGARAGVLTIRMSIVVKTVSKAAGELRVAVADEEPEALVGVVEIHEQVAGQLREPRSGRVGGDAEDVNSASGVFDNEERVEPLQGDGVEVEQVAREDCPAWARRNCDQVGPARRGAGSIPAVFRIFHDGGGADPVAESGEFAVDAPVAPGGVLSGQAQDQRADAGGDGGSAGPGVRGGPTASSEVSVPAQDR